MIRDVLCIPNGKNNISISKSLYLVNFIILIKYYKFNNVQTITLFKILNNVAVCIRLIYEIKSEPHNRQNERILRQEIFQSFQKGTRFMPQTQYKAKLNKLSARFAIHSQSKKHIFKPKMLSTKFGNRKNHGMTPQFIHKQHVLPLNHQPSIFIPCFCKKARFSIQLINGLRFSRFEIKQRESIS